MTKNNDNNLMKKKLENENKNFFVKNVIKIKNRKIQIPNDNSQKDEEAEF